MYSTSNPHKCKIFAQALIHIVVLLLCAHRLRKKKNNNQTVNSRKFNSNLYLLAYTLAIHKFFNLLVCLSLNPLVDIIKRIFIWHNSVVLIFKMKCIRLSTSLNWIWEKIHFKLEENPLFPWNEKCAKNSIEIYCSCQNEWRKKERKITTTNVIKMPMKMQIE